MRYIVLGLLLALIGAWVFGLITDEAKPLDSRRALPIPPSTGIAAESFSDDPAREVGRPDGSREQHAGTDISLRGFLRDAQTMQAISGWLTWGANSLSVPAEQGFEISEDVVRHGPIRAHSLGYSTREVSVDTLRSGVVSLAASGTSTVDVLTPTGPAAGATLHTWGAPHGELVARADDRGVALAPAGSATWVYARQGRRSSEPIRLSRDLCHRIELPWPDVARVRIDRVGERTDPCALLVRHIGIPGAPPVHLRVESQHADLDLPPGEYEVELPDSTWQFVGQDHSDGIIEGRRFGPRFRHFSISEPDIGHSVSIKITSYPSIHVRLVPATAARTIREPAEIILESKISMFGGGWTSVSSAQGVSTEDGHRFFGLDAGSLNGVGRLCIRTERYRNVYLTPNTLNGAAAEIQLQPRLNRTIRLTPPERHGDHVLMDAAQGSSESYILRRIPAHRVSLNELNFQWPGGDVYVYPPGLGDAEQETSPWAKVPGGGTRIPAELLLSSQVIDVATQSSGSIRVLNPPDGAILACIGDNGRLSSVRSLRAEGEIRFSGLPAGLYSVFPVIDRSRGPLRQAPGAVPAIDVVLGNGQDSLISWPMTWKSPRHRIISVECDGAAAEDIWVAPWFGRISSRLLTAGQLGPWRRCDQNGRCRVDDIIVEPTHLVFGCRASGSITVPVGFVPFADSVHCSVVAATLQAIGQKTGERSTVNLTPILPGIDANTSMLVLPIHDVARVLIPRTGATVDYVGLSTRLTRVIPEPPTRSVAVIGDYSSGDIEVR